MSRGNAFWVLMLVWLIWGLAWHFAWVGAFGAIGFVVLLFVLFVLLGWQTFGAPIRG